MKTIHIRRRLCPFLLLLISSATILTDLATAQTSIAVADTSSPRSTLRSFIDGCNDIHQLICSEQYFDRSDRKHVPVVRRILDCLDTSELPEFALEERSAEVATCLKEILDRCDLPRWEDVPDTAAIVEAGGFEQLSRWRIPGTRITIARVEEGPQKHEYLFSAGTVDRAVDYFRDVETRPYRTDGPTTSPGLHKWFVSVPGRPVVARIVSQLPDSVRFGRSFGMANWKWPGVIAALLIGTAVMAVAYRLQIGLAKRTQGKHTLAYCLTIVFPIAAMLTPFAVEHFAENYLTVRGRPLYIISFLTIATGTLAAIVVVFSLFQRITEAVIASPRVNSMGLNAQLIRIAFRLISLALAVVVFMMGGQYLGIPVATLLASAGIGGLALALGAQDTLKTLFGTLMLMADKPFRVGERVVIKGYDGVVEDIGLRSTKIRLLTSHQVTVPNDELARIDIENVGRRDSIRRIVDIHIPLDTPYEKLETAVAIVRRELENHEGMAPDYPPRVYFVDFLPNAFALRVIYWYHPPNYWDYLAFSEKFNFAVFRAFEEQGIQFSLPHRVTPTSLDSEQMPIEVRMVEDGRKREANGVSPAVSHPQGSR